MTMTHKQFEDDNVDNGPCYCRCDGNVDTITMIGLFVQSVGKQSDWRHQHMCMMLIAMDLLHLVRKKGNCSNQYPI